VQPEKPMEVPAQIHLSLNYQHRFTSKEKS
jgi:hypothetical protein